MDNFPIQKLGYEYWPKQLKEIPDRPKTLYYRGTLPNPEHKFLCIIGPRKYTEYGEQVCKNIIAGLAGFPITIISGLAYGIDSIVHELSINNNLNTIAFPGSGLDKTVIYPRAHFNLALKILEKGGMLLSEFPNKTEAAPWTFPKRNRLMAGISDAILVIEAGEKSGTMITSKLALDYNRDILAIPGSIFNFNSIGTNKLIKEGAIPITTSADVLDALGFNNEQINLFQKIKIQKIQSNLIENLSEIERKILEILKEPLNINQIIQRVSFPHSLIIQTLTNLEIKNLIEEKNNIFFRKTIDR